MVELPARAQVVIVGGGVIGLCTAVTCALRGWRVTVVERNSEQRDGCSFQNAGVVVPSHFVPLAAPGMYVTPQPTWPVRPTLNNGQPGSEAPIT